jgi:SAM-dependent methyltransferase
MENREQVLGLLGTLSESVWSASALSAAVEAGFVEALAAPATAAEIGARTDAPTVLVERVLDVLVALGVVRRTGDRFEATPGLATFQNPNGIDYLKADLRALLLQSGAFNSAAKRRQLEIGWRFTDPEILQAQGTLSKAATEMISKLMVPNLEGLADRLAGPDAALLDVGCGAAGFAISVAEAYPTLKVVGLEPAPAPLAEARRNVEAAGLGDRVEVRNITVQALADKDAFDLAWLPQMFLPRAVFAEGLRTVRAALRPGGWLLTASMGVPGEGLKPALARLRATLWGNTEAPDAEAVLAEVRAAGFEPAMIAPGPPNAIIRPIVGRRPL